MVLPPIMIATFNSYKPLQIKKDELRDCLINLFLKVTEINRIITSISPLQGDQKLINSLKSKI